MTPRVAVVGCGYWGKNHVRNFADLGALGAIVDPRPEVAGRLAQEHDAPAMTYDEALASSVDGVVIAAPAELHADLAMRAFAHGKHVFVEKPMALSIPDAERMTRAADAAGRMLMVGHVLQYHPAFEALLEVVRRGALGELRYAYSHRLSLGKTRVEENVLWSFAPHDLSMLLALFDQEPTAVAGVGGAYLTSGIDDQYRLDLAFPNGASAYVFASWLHPFKEHRLVIVGSDAMAVFEDSAKQGEKLRLYRHRADTSRRPPELAKADAEAIPHGTDEPLKRECQHFLDCIRENRRPRTDAQEGLRVLRVLTKLDAKLSVAEVA